MRIHIKSPSGCKRIADYHRGMTDVKTQLKGEYL